MIKVLKHKDSNYCIGLEINLSQYNGVMENIESKLIKKRILAKITYIDKYLNQWPIFITY